MEAETERRRLDDFRARVLASTPRLFVTQLIVAANLLIFALMVLKEGGLWQPSGAALKAWGANYGPLTMTTQPWRLFTSMFIHIGVMHVAFNMWALWGVGRLVERLVGNLGFALLYVVSGIAGSMASVAWNPTVLSAGASGAIFGVFGALLGFLALRRDCVPSSVLLSIRNSTLGFFLFSLVFGYTVPGIDLACHIGGAGAGFVCGLILSRPIQPAAWRGRALRDALLAVVGSAAIAAGIVVLPRVLHAGSYVTFEQLTRFGEVDRMTYPTFAHTVEELNAGKITRLQAAEVIEREIVAPWEALGKQFAGLKAADAKQQRLLPLLSRYIETQVTTWTLQSEAIRQQDRRLEGEAAIKKEELKNLVKMINALQTS